MEIRTHVTPEFYAAALRAAKTRNLSLPELIRRSLAANVDFDGTVKGRPHSETYTRAPKPSDALIPSHIPPGVVAG